MASFWLGLAASKMSAFCLTQICFGAAGISGGMQVKDGYTVIKSMTKSAVTSVTAPHGFVTLVSSKALGIEVIANQTKRDIFTRCGDHVAYFMADDQDSYSRLLSLSIKRADDRISAANQLPNDTKEPEIKPVNIAFNGDTFHNLAELELCPMALSNVDFTDFEIFIAPPSGWTPEILNKALCCPRAMAFRAKWSAVDCYLVGESEAGIERHWIGSSEPY